jgi:mRNA-degrading endonuclease RelE of RelBE toxin-antitoxin system
VSHIFVKATSKFLKDIKKLLNAEELEELYDYLSENPTAGVVIKSTGGVRKLRWSVKSLNKGKSGGLRILYHYSNNILVILLGAFSKSEAQNISEAEKNTLKKILPNLIEQLMEDL